MHTTTLTKQHWGLLALRLPVVCWLHTADAVAQLLLLTLALLLLPLLLSVCAVPSGSKVAVRCNQPSTGTWEGLVIRLSATTGAGDCDATSTLDTTLIGGTAPRVLVTARALPAVCNKDNTFSVDFDVGVTPSSVSGVSALSTVATLMASSVTCNAGQGGWPAAPCMPGAASLYLLVHTVAACCHTNFGRPGLVT